MCHPCKDNQGQAVLSLDEKVLDILGNTTLFEPFVLLIKINQTFVIGQHGCVAGVDSDWNLSKIFQIKKEFLMET